MTIYAHEHSVITGWLITENKLTIIHFGQRLEAANLPWSGKREGSSMGLTPKTQVPADKGR